MKKGPLSLEEMPSAPGVVEAGEGGENERAIEGDLDEPSFGGGESVKDVGGGVFDEEPHEGGEAEGELKGGFPFAEVIGGDDLALFDRDLTETSDEKLAGDDDRGDPHGAESQSGEVDEGGRDENFVGERIEELSEGGDQIEFAREVAIEEIREGGESEGDEGHDIAADRCRSRRLPQRWR